MKHTRNTSNVMRKHMRMLPVFLVAVVALVLVTAAPEVLAQPPLELEAKIIFETNFTDRDTGIQVFTDGEPWKWIEIYDPDENLMLKIEANGDLQNFGLTELFSESNEPNWDDMPLADILALFPEGEYVFKGESVEGEEMEGEATLSHHLPCAPELLAPAEASFVPMPNGADVIISWNHVTNSLGIANQRCIGRPITVETYQVVVENLTSEKDFSIFLEAQPGVNTVTLPTQFVTPNSIYKYEVLAIALEDEENGNQTIAESFFCTGPDGNDCELPEE